MSPSKHLSHRLSLQPGGPVVAGLLAARRARSRHHPARHAAAVDTLAQMIAEETHGMVSGFAGGGGDSALSGGLGRRRPAAVAAPRPHLKRSVVAGGQRRLAWVGGSLLSSVLDAFNRVRRAFSSRQALWDLLCSTAYLRCIQCH